MTYLNSLDNVAITRFLGHRYSIALIVISPAGRTINDFRSFDQLLIALRKATKAHQPLLTVEVKTLTGLSELALESIPKSSSWLQRICRL